MAEKSAQKVEDLPPDPEEDDLSDLDDVLDEFQKTSISPLKPTSSSTKTAPSASGPGRPESKGAEDNGTTTTKPPSSEDDLAAQLQAGMSSLISELDANPEMQAEFEKMMQELIAAGGASTDQDAAEHLKTAAETISKDTSTAAKPSSGSSSTSKKAPAEDFQSTIRKTMERMQASDTAATSNSTTAQSEDDLLAQMMKELTEGGEGGDFNSMLLKMMSELTNKEILYDPMKELHDKFPAWLDKNRTSISEEDLARYEEQSKLVNEIVARFERKGYSDENEDDREYIVERMQKMQEAGSPPSDLVGDMNAAHEALGEMDSGCPQQ